MAQYKAGWYPDPYAAKGSGVLRWYDGSGWTSNVNRPRTAARPRATTRATATARPRPAARSVLPSAQHGATWESIPQPGTTFTRDGLNRPALRVRIGPAVLTLIVLAIVVAVIATVVR